MDSTIFDTITTTFVGAFQSGTATLAQYSLPLLAIFATIAFYLQLGPLLASGGVGAGDAIASTLLTILKIGVFYWLLVRLAPLTTAAFQTFLQWGAAPGDGGLSEAAFLTPSKVVDVGFAIVTPIRTYTDRLLNWAAVWSWPTLLTYVLAYYLILLAFAGIALHLMMTIIEFHLAVMAATVLLPWGGLPPTAFFAEFSIGWVTGGLVRILLTAAMVGIALPLFASIKVTTIGPDPTLYTALLAGLSAGVFLVLSWVIPARAAAIAGRGVSLALHGGTIVSAAASGGRGVAAVARKIRGEPRLAATR